MEFHLRESLLEDLEQEEHSPSSQLSTPDTSWQELLLYLAGFLFIKKLKIPPKSTRKYHTFRLMEIVILLFLMKWAN